MRERLWEVRCARKISRFERLERIFSPSSTTLNTRFTVASNLRLFVLRRRRVDLRFVFGISEIAPEVSVSRKAALNNYIAKRSCLCPRPARISIVSLIEYLHWILK